MGSEESQKCKQYMRIIYIKTKQGGKNSSRDSQTKKKWLLQTSWYLTLYLRKDSKNGKVFYHVVCESKEKTPIDY